MDFSELSNVRATVSNDLISPLHLAGRNVRLLVKISEMLHQLGSDRCHLHILELSFLKLFVKGVCRSG